MNYYPFHVGDYAAHTAHLDLLEDLAYRRMLDLYYLRECALPHDPAEVARLIRMRGNVAEVTAVLREFFTEFEGGWVNGRCEEEILRMKDKQTKAKASAEASVAARRAKAEGHRSTPAERTLNERSTDAELPTPTPTPTPTPNTAKAVGASRRKPQTALPEDFAPNDVGMNRAAEKHLDVPTELEKFRNHHAAKGAVMADWQAAWRTWVGNARPGTLSVHIANGPKRGSDEYAALHKSAEWWRAAGFPTIWDAMASKCWHDNAIEFRDGQRVGVAA